MPPLTLITSPAHCHLALPRHIKVLRRRFSDRPLTAKQHRAHRLVSQAHMAEHASLHALSLVTLFPLSSLKSRLLIFFLSISIIPSDFPFRLVQQSKQNTVDALTLHPQSRPSIHHTLPLKIEYRTLLWITSPCGIVAGDAHSLLFLSLLTLIS